MAPGIPAQLESFGFEGTRWLHSNLGSSHFEINQAVLSNSGGLARNRLLRPPGTTCIATFAGPFQAIHGV